MYRMFKTLESILLFTLVASSVAGEPNCYIKLSPEETRGVQANRALIESYGGRIIHEFPKADEYICQMAPSQFKLFVKDHAARGEHKALGPSFPVNKSELTIAAFCWNYLQNREKELQNNNRQESFICGTAGISSLSDARVKSSQDARSISRTEMFNAEYLVGKTAVCIVLPESNGSTENWTTAEQDTAIAEVVQAYDNLSNLAYERNIDVSWVYEIHRSVPVTEEPIEHPRPDVYVPPFDTWNFGWMNDALNYLGADSEWPALFANANRMRQQYKTDWGLTYFMVKDAKNHLTFRR
jgi:hypothetical protein